ncbi:MAG: DUF5615 family PIN-like protein [Balneolales bacterium]|nr:DUF5615 family PIN-like protein [Balneolales bacterium]
MTPKRFLVDANLPYHFSVWHDDAYIHQFDLGDSWTDEQIWEYAQQHNLTIVTKDADFSHKIVLSQPPPRVIHIRIGNLKLADLHKFIHTNWAEITRLSSINKLVTVRKDGFHTIT